MKFLKFAFFEMSPNPFGDTLGGLTRDYTLGFIAATFSVLFVQIAYF